MSDDSVLLIFSVVWAILTALYASRKGRNPLLAGVVGFILGIWGFLIYFTLYSAIPWIKAAPGKNWSKHGWDDPNNTHWQEHIPPRPDRD